MRTTRLAKSAFPLATSSGSWPASPSSCTRWMRRTYFMWECFSKNTKRTSLLAWWNLITISSVPSDSTITPSPCQWTSSTIGWGVCGTAELPNQCRNLWACFLASMSSPLWTLNLVIRSNSNAWIGCSSTWAAIPRPMTLRSSLWRTSLLELYRDIQQCKAFS